MVAVRVAVGTWVSVAVGKGAVVWVGDSGAGPSPLVPSPPSVDPPAAAVWATMVWAISSGLSSSSVPDPGNAHACKTSIRAIITVSILRVFLFIWVLLYVGSYLLIIMTLIIFIISQMHH
jgi:hypothetical protein